MLKRLYMEKKKARGCKVQPRSNNSGDWERAALLVRELNAEPEDFIDAAFHYCTLSTGPFANGLGGRQAAEWWRQWAALKGVPRTEKVDGETFSPAMRALRQRVDYTRAILLNRHNSPFFNEVTAVSVLDRSLRLDPLACMLLGGHDKRVKDMYLQDALDILGDDMATSKALQDLGIDITNITV